MRGISHGSRRTAFLVRKEQCPVAEHRQPVGELCLRVELGQGSPSALFGGFDHLQAKALGFDLIDDGTAGEHGREARNAQFACFLGKNVEPRAADGRGTEPQVGHRFAGAEMGGDRERDVALCRGNDFGRPFAGRVVEQLQHSADLHPHDVEKIMCLRAVDGQNRVV